MIFRIHCFEGVTAIMFIVAISGYDACLVEDKDSVSPITGNSSTIVQIPVHLS